MVISVIDIVFSAIYFFVALFFAWYFILRGFAAVAENEVGIVTRKLFGKKMPQGQIIACDEEVGIQADTLMPRLYWRFPIIWTIEKAKVTHIKAGQLGTVESVDGKPITAGRLLGDEVPCNSFQDAKAFLLNGGSKGPQVAVLPPGTYRINTKVFAVEYKQATIVPERKIGQVIARDGIPLPSEYMVAPGPEGEHDHFQNGQAFILNKGYRGPQLETLQPGTYYINPLLYDVIQEDVYDVPPGYAAVVRSNVGTEIEQPKTPATKAKMGEEADDSIAKPLQKDEVMLTTDKKTRGIHEKAILPSVFNMNKLAYSPYLVPTSAITIDWVSEGGFVDTPIKGDAPTKGTEAQKSEAKKSKGEYFFFNPVAVTTKDGFILYVDVRLILRIDSMHAPYVISRFGTIKNLIDQIAHPLIESSFRNEAGEKEALLFVHSRTPLQASAFEKAQKEFQKYFVEVQNLLIGNIITPKELLDTQTNKQIAIQQQTQYDEQAKAEKQRIAVQENTARANKQKEVIDAKLAIEIADDKANAARKEADGIRDATKSKAEGEAFREREVGQAIATAYKAQVDAFGAKTLAAVKIIDAIGREKVKITPDILVNGGSNEGGTAVPLLNTALIALVASQMPKLTAGDKSAADPSTSTAESKNSTEKTEQVTEKIKDLKVPDLAKPGDKATTEPPAEKNDLKEKQTFNP